MELNIAIGIASLWMLFMCFQITTYSFMATVWYKIVPVAIIIALVVLRGLE